MVGMAEVGAPISLDGMAVHPDCWCICLCYLHFAPENPEDSKMYLLVPAHPGYPRQSTESHKMVVCVLCVCVRVPPSLLFFLMLLFCIWLQVQISYTKSLTVQLLVSYAKCKSWSCNELYQYKCNHWKLAINVFYWHKQQIICWVTGRQWQTKYYL